MASLQLITFLDSVLCEAPQIVQLWSPKFIRFIKPQIAPMPPSLLEPLEIGPLLFI